MCCCKCCLWCLQKIVAFINRNAYIILAIKGTNYCESAMTAVKLIVTVRRRGGCDGSVGTEKSRVEQSSRAVRTRWPACRRDCVFAAAVSPCVALPCCRMRCAS